MSRVESVFTIPHDGSVYIYRGKFYDVIPGDLIRVYMKKSHLYINGTPMCSESLCMKPAKWAVGSLSIHLCSKCVNGDKYHMMSIVDNIEELAEIRKTRLRKAKTGQLERLAARLKRNRVDSSRRVYAKRVRGFL